MSLPRSRQRMRTRRRTRSSRRKQPLRAGSTQILRRGTPRRDARAHEARASSYVEGLCRARRERVVAAFWSQGPYARVSLLPGKRRASYMQAFWQVCPASLPPSGVRDGRRDMAGARMCRDCGSAREECLMVLAPQSPPTLRCPLRDFAHRRLLLRTHLHQPEPLSPEEVTT